MIGCIIQARMGSSRLPGKVLMDLEDKKTVLLFTVEQLRHCKYIEKIVIATTKLREDNKIANFARKIKISYFRGNSKNVLDRYYNCAKKFRFSTIVRITADCPLIDPQIVDRVIQKFKEDSFDYVSNVINRTFPYGTEVEVFSFQALENAWANATLPYEREHVTPFFYKQKGMFRTTNIEYVKNISHLRYTVDYINDLELVRMIVSNIKNRPILLKNILDLFTKKSELTQINKRNNEQ